MILILMYIHTFFQKHVTFRKNLSTSFVQIGYRLHLFPLPFIIYCNFMYTVYI